MDSKDRPSQRNKLDFVPPGTKRGEVLSYSPLPRAYVTELRDSPDGWEHSPIEVGRVLPGQRVALTLSGWPFEFIVRVVTDADGRPQIVDLRMRSPVELGDVPITNADLKAVPVAALAAFAIDPKIPGLDFTPTTGDEGDAATKDKPRRSPGRPTKLTDAFLRDVSRLAREAWECRYPINDFVSGALLEDGKIDRPAKPETVRGWLKAARARRRHFPSDASFLGSGELRGTPPDVSNNA